MVELVLLVCVIAEPEKCEEILPPFQQPMTVNECLHQGPLVAARWSRTHPDWQVKGWVCGGPRA